MSVSERNPCISTKKNMEPRGPVVTARFFRVIFNGLREMNGAILLSPYAASLTLRRTGLYFLFFASRGSAAAPLHALPKC